MRRMSSERSHCGTCGSKISCKTPATFPFPWLKLVLSHKNDAIHWLKTTTYIFKRAYVRINNETNLYTGTWSRLVTPS